MEERIICVQCGREYVTDEDGELYDTTGEQIPLSDIGDEPVCQGCVTAYYRAIMETKR